MNDIHSHNIYIQSDFYSHIDASAGEKERARRIHNKKIRVAWDFAMLLGPNIDCKTLKKQSIVKSAELNWCVVHKRQNANIIVPIFVPFRMLMLISFFFFFHSSFRSFLSICTRLSFCWVLGSFFFVGDSKIHYEVSVVWIMHFHIVYKVLRSIERVYFVLFVCMRCVCTVRHEIWQKASQSAWFGSQK